MKNLLEKLYEATEILFRFDLLIKEFGSFDEKTFREPPYLKPI